MVGVQVAIVQLVMELGADAMTTRMATPDPSSAGKVMAQLYPWGYSSYLMKSEKYVHD
jgi:hypothetical protein